MNAEVRPPYTRSHREESAIAASRVSPSHRNHSKTLRKDFRSCRNRCLPIPCELKRRVIIRFCVRPNVCDAITKNGTRCRRDGFCWQHSRSRVSQKTHTLKLVPPRIERRIDSAWFGGDWRNLVGNLAVGLFTGLIVLGVQVQTQPRIEVVNSVPEARPTTVASNHEASCPADRPAKNTFTASSPDSSLSAPAYAVSLQDVVQANANSPASSFGININDVAKNGLPQDLNDLKASVFAGGQLAGVQTIQLPNWASANNDTMLNPNIVSSANLMTVPTGGVFEPSKAIGPPLDQIKTLMEASGIDSLQTGIAQSTNFQMPAYVGTLTDNPTRSGIQPASLTINGGGTPAVLPTTWQTFPANSGPTFPVTAPNVLQPNSQ